MAVMPSTSRRLRILSSSLRLPPTPASYTGLLRRPPTPASYAGLLRRLPTPVGTRFYLRPAYQSAATTSFSVDYPKHADQAEPTAEEVEEWDANKLLKWIHENRPTQLQGDEVENFRAARISGEVFLMKAGDVRFFKSKCNLPIGPSEALAALSRKIAEKKQDTATIRKGPPHTDEAPVPERARVGNSSLIINGKLEHFRSGLNGKFSSLLRREGQAYFDRTRYIFKLHELDNSILFCRPRRFGKSLTISMLEHFHGLQYVGEHQSLYKGLDVQKYIDQRQAEKKKYVKPGQYFVLKFDFSRARPNPDLTKANEALITMLNSSIKWFYKEYAAYLGGNPEALYQGIHSEDPNASLVECANLVRDAIKSDKRLANIEGIYLLIDEYDSFPNNYLGQPNAVRGPKLAWEDTVVGLTFKSFWATIKSLGMDGIISRAFITGISPLSLSAIGSGFNVANNMSFDKNLAGLCGLTFSDLKDALTGIYQNPQACDGFLSEMTGYFNGYHFCKDEPVETTYNTETCLAYLQHCIHGTTPETRDPPNSEISELFLKKCAASAPVIRDFEEALEYDEKEGFKPFEYGRFRTQFSLQDLRQDTDGSSWRSLIVYFGGLTFHPEKPTTHLRIPNRVAADRIALAVLQKYNLSHSLSAALRRLVNYGELEQVLGCYRELMIQRDVTTEDLTQKDEAAHRDSFYFSLLRNDFLVPRAEFKVTKPSKKGGRVDLIVQVPGRLIVTEWKFYRINFLQFGGKMSALTKADILRDYKLSDIPQLQFGRWDKYRRGTIRSWVLQTEAQQLRDYIKSAEVQQMVEKDSLELQAHLVIVVGSRHILLWDMDKEGILAPEPRVVQVPHRSKRPFGSQNRLRNRLHDRPRN